MFVLSNLRVLMMMALDRGGYHLTTEDMGMHRSVYELHVTKRKDVVHFLYHALVIACVFYACSMINWWAPQNSSYFSGYGLCSCRSYPALEIFEQ